MAYSRRTGPRSVAWVLLVLGLVVVTVVGLFWAFQRSLIYHPDPAAPAPVEEVLPDARELALRTDDGLDLTAWFLPADPRTDRELAVLYAPGNGGNRQGRAGIARDLSDRGFTVLLMDYRGFGGNPGSPTEEGLATDAEAALRALADEGFPLERTIYLGESLGGGVVARLQADHPPAGMVLRSPFTQLADVASHHYPFLPVGLLLRDRFPVTEHLAASAVPVSVVRGTADSVLPTSLSEEVARVADSRGNLVEEVVLEGVDHNDAEMFGPPVADAVVRLAESLG
ncbi:alpha/beta hydrolase [Ornithinimicrobium sp. F0845]|uniref:alpha/beta hydrolase n=1 Tax=Ornithinimicrobium sp. F0845 TaxID=2926412 RepID=UPI001FF64504|nr:alpha/beta hydrolase [Ornithinimicrobium sp. F0845]MCK0112507.1 alpha/beta hydrolase [Ornithinimicrobium sp. F0845]